MTCVDFTDLKQVCPKDSYHFPNINKLIDGSFRYLVHNFIDAYFGYYQIKMHIANRPKTTLMTNNYNYCHEEMLFGFKNLGATYLRLMDMIFNIRLNTI